MSDVAADLKGRMSKQKGARKNLDEAKQRAFGYHLLLDLYHCDSKAVASLDRCYYYLDALPDIIGSNKQCPPLLFFTNEKRHPDKAGLSGWVAIVDSGISIHTIIPFGFVSIDVYSCTKFDVERVKAFTIELFKPREVEEKFIVRGERYWAEREESPPDCSDG